MTQLFGMVTAVGLKQIMLDLLRKNRLSQKLRVNGIESELTGTLYQATGKSPSCLYDYREIEHEFNIPK